MLGEKNTWLCSGRHSIFRIDDADLSLVHDPRNGAWGFKASFTNGDSQQVLLTSSGIQLNDGKTNALIWLK